MMGVLNKFFITSICMLAAPIAILYGFNDNLFPDDETLLKGRGKLLYIHRDMPPPNPTDSNFEAWGAADAAVRSWIQNSMEPSLVANFARYPTARQLWEALSTTFYDGSDITHIYELRRSVGRLRQAGITLEQYYGTLQGIWRDIDFRRPNPMQDPEDMNKYNKIIQEERVLQFLVGLDDRLDAVRREVLNTQPFPTVEQAYALARRENRRLTVMMENETPTGIGLAIQGGRSDTPRSSFRTTPGISQITGRNGEKGKLPVTCEHCGGAKHTKDNCFKLHGYPEWWTDLQAKKKKGGRVAMATGSGGNTDQKPSIPAQNLTSTVSTTSGNGGILATSSGGVAPGFAANVSRGGTEGYSYEGDHWTWY